MVGTRGGGTGGGAPQQGNANNEAENLAPMNLNPQQIAAIFAAMQQAQQQPLAPVNEQTKKPKSKKKEKKSPRTGKKAKAKFQREYNTDNKWMTIPPKAGKEDEKKTKDGKDWNYCQYHKKWVIIDSKLGRHTTATCRLNPKFCYWIGRCCCIF